MNEDQNQSNNGGGENLYEQAGAFQKIWAESMSSMAQAAFTFSPESAPPEMARNIRKGIFQAVAKSWDEFMRSPQFMQAMKQMMDNAISLRQTMNDALTRAHHELQGTARTDIDTLMMAIHHMEKRVLDRVDTLTERVDALEKKLAAKPAPAPVAAKPARAGKKASTPASKKK